VAAFHDRRIGFLDVAELVEHALSQVDGSPARDLGELLAADATARRAAQGRLAPV
jgi:1-deoxy-D-xylulose 5-phosphate reductoisomerase